MTCVGDVYELKCGDDVMCERHAMCYVYVRVFAGYGCVVESMRAECMVQVHTVEVKQRVAAGVATAPEAS